MFKNFISWKSIVLVWFCKIYRWFLCSRGRIDQDTKLKLVSLKKLLNFWSINVRFKSKLLSVWFWIQFKVLIFWIKHFWLDFSISFEFLGSYFFRYAVEIGFKNFGVFRFFVPLVFFLRNAVLKVTTYFLDSFGGNCGS